MAIDKRFALIDTDGHYRFPYKKAEESTGRYGFAIGRDRHGRAEYTDRLERVIEAVVFEGLGARMKAAGIKGKNGNTVSLHAQREITGYWIDPELLHLVAGASFRPINDVKKGPGFEVAAFEKTSDTTAAPKQARKLSEDELRHQLERQSETGKAGELMVVLDEMARLVACGCQEPENYVQRVSESDVGRGYDIESKWPGEERCIEVKTTTSPGSDFYLTLNEINALGDLGAKAWLYRVALDTQGGGAITLRLQDPLKSISEEQMVPIVWRVKGWG